MQRNRSTAGFTETERGLQRREALTSASSSGTCGSLPRSGCVGFVTRRRRGTRGARHAHWFSGPNAGDMFWISCLVAEMHPLLLTCGVVIGRAAATLALLRAAGAERVLPRMRICPLLICAGWRLDMGLSFCSVDPVHHADAAHAFGRRDSATSGP